MHLLHRSFLRPLSLALAGMATAMVAHAATATLQNAGFDTATNNNANYWASNGTPPGIGGTVRGGANGGFGWTSGYFAGGFPTNSTFATTFSGTAMRQDLTGSGSTFVAGATYTITAKLFSAGAYGTAQTARIIWSLGLTADGTPVAIDHWFSDEFGSQKVSSGGPIPDDHIVNVASGSNGLTTATVTFTATAAQAGKTIGIQIGGNTQSKYTPVTGTMDPYYGMMDSITFDSTAIAKLDSFTSDKTVIDGEPVTLFWGVSNPTSAATLTLNDGTNTTNVLAATDMIDGFGTTTVNPTANTTYTLTLDGGTSKQLTIFNGQVVSLNTSVRIAKAPDFKTTLSWEVRPLGATVSISDGTNTVDVTGDTDAETGIGSRDFVVPSASTNFTISVNNGSVTKAQRVLRAVEANEHFGVNSNFIVTGNPVTATWTNTGAASGSWIGVYSLNKTPGPNPSDQWNYISGTSGSMNFTLPAGDYFAILFVDGNYTIEQGPVMFTVGTPVVVDDTIKVMSLQRGTDALTGEQVTLVWDSKAGVTYEIYASNNLQGDPKTAWEHIATALPSAGDDGTSFTEDLPEPTPASRFYKIYETEVGN